MAEKRKCKRKIKGLPVICSSHGLECRGYSSNFSDTGMFIRTSKPFKSGVPIKITISVGEECNICLAGVSVRATNIAFLHSRNGMGIKLISESSVYKNFMEEIAN